MPGPTGQAKLDKLAASVRTGGKGSVRRKKKVVASSTGSSGQKLSAVLKKQGVNPIQGVEEVNFFAQDGSVLHFNKPKVQANFPANTYLISGHSEKKSLMDLMPGILRQLNMNDLGMLKQLAGSAGAAAAAEDDDAPPLVESFERAE